MSIAVNGVAGGTTTGASLTIAASGDFYTITRAAGDWLADGFFIGSIVRLTGAGFAPANVGNNLLVVGLTASVATVVALSATPLVAEGPIAAAGMSVVGKQSYVPLTGHTESVRGLHRLEASIYCFVLAFYGTRDCFSVLHGKGFGSNRNISILYISCFYQY